MRDGSLAEKRCRRRQGRETRVLMRRAVEEGDGCFGATGGWEERLESAFNLMEQAKGRGRKVVKYDLYPAVASYKEYDWITNYKHNGVNQR